MLNVFNETGKRADWEGENTKIFINNNYLTEHAQDTVYSMYIMYASKYCMSVWQLSIYRVNESVLNGR